MDTKKHSLRESVRETPEVHVAGVCIREGGSEGIEILIARRDDDRSFYPGFIEGCGGQLRRSETFEEGVRRHFAAEMNLIVKVVEEHHCFYLIDDRIPGKCQFVES